MKRKTLHLLHLIEFFIISFVIVVFLLANPRTLNYLANKITQSTNLKYKDVSGNLLTTINIKELSFKSKLIAKEAKIDFNLFKLLSGKVEVDNLLISKINLKNLLFFIKSLKGDNQSQNSFDLGFVLHNAVIDFTPFSEGKYKIKKALFILKDINANDLKSIDAKKMIFDVSTNIWKLYAKGYVKKSIFYADANVSLDDNYFQKFIKGIDYNSLNPIKVVLKVDKDSLEGDLNTSSKRLFYKKYDFLNLSIKKLSTHAKFIFKDLNLFFNSKIKASSKYAKDIKIDGDFYYKKGKSFYYHGDMKLDGFKNLDKNITYLLKDLTINFKGNKKGINAFGKSRFLDAFYDSNTSYKKALITINSKELDLKDFLKVPKEIKDTKFTFNIKSRIDYKKLKDTKIAYKVVSNLVDIDGSYKLFKNKTGFDVTLPDKSILKNINKDIKYENIFPIKSTLEKQKQGFNIKATSKLLNLSTFYFLKSKDFNSTIKLNGLDIFIKKQKDLYLYDIDINTLYTLEDTLKIIYPQISTNIDGKLHIKGNYKDDIFAFSLDAKWLLYEYEKYRFLYFQNLSSNLNFKNKNLTIYNYSSKAFIYGEYRDIFSFKSSTFNFDKNVTLIDFYLNDAVNIRGKLAKDLNLFIKATNYHFKQPEANLFLNFDLNYKKSKSFSILRGDISILSGEIFYKVRNQRSISDKDIIFVNQKKQKKDSSKLALDIKIKSNKISYKREKNTIFFKTNLFLKKDIKKELKADGSLTVFDGVYFSEGKKFELGFGKVMFNGDLLNPYLNLKAYYKKDPYTITILIGGRLDSPSLTFSSDPYLTQNDILSILLFNTKSSNLTNINSNQNLNITIFGSALAKGVTKSLGLKLDRVDFTTSKDGKVGIELEKRVGKKTTIIYQNDIIQTIKIRYENSKNIETDFTFSPESSGIDIIYKNEK